MNTLVISVDADLESIIFTADFKDGWAALALQDFVADVFYQPYNAKYARTAETTPPKIGGQSPVLKSEALDDLAAGAACVRHYIKLGKLSPQVEWGRAD